MSLFLPWKRSSRAGNAGSTLPHPDSHSANSETIGANPAVQLERMRDTVRAYETRLTKAKSSRAPSFDGRTEPSAKHTIQQSHDRITASLNDKLAMWMLITRNGGPS